MTVNCEEYERRIAKFSVIVCIPIVVIGDVENEIVLGSRDITEPKSIKNLI